MPILTHSCPRHRLVELGKLGTTHWPTFTPHTSHHSVANFSMDGPLDRIDDNFLLIEGYFENQGAPASAFPAKTSKNLRHP